MLLEYLYHEVKSVAQLRVIVQVSDTLTVNDAILEIQVLPARSVASTYQEYAPFPRETVDHVFSPV